MSNKKLKEKEISKKEVKTIVYKKLEAALSDFSKTIKPKKFKASLKKASKLFATDIAKASGKPNVVKATKVKGKAKAADKKVAQPTP